MKNKVDYGKVSFVILVAILAAMFLNEVLNQAKFNTARALCDKLYYAAIYWDTDNRPLTSTRCMNIYREYRDER